jgi:translocation and assembly module TamB
VLALGVLLAVPLIALAQSNGDEQEKSFFLKFVQDRLSTPDRQISISNIDGALSSVASIREVTISDQKGVYLTIRNVALDWNQGAIFLGRLEVNSLTADSIEYTRNPVPAENTPPALPSPEAGGLSIPQLPVAVILRKLSIPRITLGKDTFGVASTLSLDGRATLDGGSLDAALAIKRLDGPAGAFDLAAKYDKASTNLDLDLSLVEGRDGLIGTVLHLENRPDFRFEIKGSGPVANLGTALTLDAGGTRVLDGRADIRQQNDGFAVTTHLGGPIATLMAPAYRDFFGADASLDASGLLRSAGGVQVDKFALAGGQVHLTGSAATSADWFLDRLQVDGDIADPNGGPVVLPVAGANTKLESAHLAVGFGGSDQNWRASVEARGFSNATLGADRLVIAGSGVGANLDDPAARRLTFNVDGRLDGVTSPDAGIADALGDSIGLGAAGLWNAGQPLELAQFRLAGKAVSFDTAGTFDKGVFNGRIALAASSLAPFSGLTGHALAGAIDLKATGSVSPLIGGFDLDLDGTGSNLAIGEPTADGLLKGTVRLTGGVARTEEGITARQFRLGNTQVQLGADGRFASTAADFRFDLGVADLKLLSEKATGALAVSGTAKGQDSAIALDLSAKVPSGSLAGRPLSSAAFSFTGALKQAALTGDISGTANLAGQIVSLASGISSADGVNHLSGLTFSAGGTKLAGDVTRRKDGLFEGRLTLDASDISTAAALALLEASGSAKADIALATDTGKQTASVAAAVSALKVAGASVGSADLKAGVTDLFGVPMVNGSLDGRQIAAGGVTAETVSGNAKWDGGQTNFDADAALSSGTKLAIAGALAPIADGYRIGLDRASLQQGTLAANLARPAALAISRGVVTLDAVAFDIGKGSLTATGSAGQTLDISVALKALPLSTANAVSPALGLAGTLDGTAHVTGAAARPQASFAIRGQGIGAAAIRDLGVTPLSLDVGGSYADSSVQLAKVALRSPGGLTVDAHGTLPLSLSGLDLTAAGSAPLALGNRFVADRGGQASGTARFSARVTGSAGDPRITGQASVDGGGYVDPALNLKLLNITARASLNGTSASLDRLSANVATGGTISGSGRVSLAPGNAGDLKLALNRFRYVDEPLLVTTVSGNLAVTGPLATAPVIGGTVNVERAEISVPSQVGGGAAAIDVRHVNAPKPVAQSLDRSKANAARTSRPAPAAAGPRLDLTVNAPNRIFIRGRGLDAEMGGSLRLTGSLADVQPVGGFDLIRGRLDILGQRLTFNSGSVTMTGSLDPELAFAATVPSDDITVKVTVSGRASDPDIAFSSSPALAQDEVLSRLLFKQGIENLSPMQLARLAGAAATLAGGGPSPLDDFRNSVGLDDLDLVTDAQGNTGVQAGRYLTDNVYMGVQAGANGKSKVTLNLDLAPGLKANAGTGTDGDSGIGVLYEQDY